MEPPKKKLKLSQAPDFKLSKQLTYRRQFFARDEADKILATLRAQVTFPEQRHKVKVRGTWHSVPRDQVAYGQPDDEGQTPTYWFSGNYATSLDWTKIGWIQKLLDRVEALVEARPTFMLINRYPNGKSYISPHSDSERGLVPGLPIVSLTFGAERDFQVYRKGKSCVAKTFVLHHGSLLNMSWAFNERWKHGVPKRAGVLSERWNLTFRFMGASV